MRIELKQEGGFAALPGLNKLFTLDTNNLQSAQTRKMSDLVSACHFFDLPSVATPPHGGAADYYTYTLTITDGKRHKTIVRSDPVSDTDVQALIDFVQEMQRGG